MTERIKSPRKLIEVAMPLDAINDEASLRKRKAPAGYPTTLHKWWAQRPLAAARAVIFAQMVNDPGYQQGDGFRYGMNKKEAAVERERLFKIMEDLVLWESTNNEEVLGRARAEILRSWQEVCALNKEHPRAAEFFSPEHLPTFGDPFAGSGAIPLEAQRLGMDVFASDLNPVAVLINKAMLDLPMRFKERSPVCPARRDPGGMVDLGLSRSWPKATGLAEDVRQYGAWVQSCAKARIGESYPSISISADMAHERPDLKTLVGKRLDMIACLWARTVQSPNPGFSHAHVPLVTTFILSTKSGNEAYVQPVIEGDSYRFAVRSGKPPGGSSSGTTAGKRKAFICLLSGSPIDYGHIRSEGKAGRLGQRLMAVVAQGPRGRLYLSSTDDIAQAAVDARPTWRPETPLPDNPRDFKTPNYGLTTFGDLFTARQTLVLDTISELIIEVRQRIRRDAAEAGMRDDGIGLDAGGCGATAYAEAITLYLAFALDRLADYGCSLSTWRPKDSAMRSGLAKQALPMSWDFAEGNPFGQSSSGFTECVEVVAKVLATSLAPAVACTADVAQGDAARGDERLQNAVISTDPPYYDNIGYADLSDFFYVWLRRTQRPVFSSTFATLVVPKADELVATPYRHGGTDNAEAFFLAGMTSAMAKLGTQAHPAFPVTIYYAFKQSETSANETSSTGWETFLAAVVRAGLEITGTWPVRTEGDNRQVGVGNNALASSIVLVCRHRSPLAPTVSRRAFIRELNAVLPAALDEMTRGVAGEYAPLAPVDLSQAIIGPGMAVYSKYAAVLEADGSPMPVRSALHLINSFLAEDDFDAATQFCLHWFERYGWTDGPFGDANLLAQSKGTAPDGMKAAGILKSGGGKVRLLRWSEYPSGRDQHGPNDWSVWQSVHELIRALSQGGEEASGALLGMLDGKTDAARQLAYRLYTLCGRSGLSEDARAYNELITSWTGIELSSTTHSHNADPQGLLFDR